jgi:hypothetical protein
MTPGGKKEEQIAHNHDDIIWSRHGYLFKLSGSVRDRHCAYSGAQERMNVPQVVTSGRWGTFAFYFAPFAYSFLRLSEKKD